MKRNVASSESMRLRRSLRCVAFLMCDYSGFSQRFCVRPFLLGRCENGVHVVPELWCVHIYG